ncbi:FecR family protein [Candidatus Electronema sp. JC]|uniref:FecR family protein n=1 Tax=Candidatus Electronema sp. JC TaxID=3401570 RepID=UPI003B431040
MKIRKKTAWLALPLCLLSSAGRAEKNCPSEQELLQVLTAEVQPAESLLLAAPETDCQTPTRDRGPAVGTVQTVQGTALIISADGCNASRLRKSLPLPVFTGDTLVTAAKSRVTLLMRDQSRLTLAGQSRMIIDKAVYDPAASRRDTRLRLILGRLRAVVAKMTEKNLYRIQTPAATAGVRGTDFALAVSPELTVLLTGGGSSAVELTDRNGGTTAVGPLSAACPVCPPAHVGKKAQAVLHEIAPELDAAAAADETCWWMRWRCK